ncbi:MAG TPA: EAL domain-containing protein [Chromatiales bacterium]|nr:EAL domain-containing protein [Chromatiales bacterium]
MDKDNVLRLLIVETSQNDAEIIASVLCNAGYAVRARNAEDGEDMARALQDQVPDLVICSTELDGFDLGEAVELLARTGKTIPVIATATSPDEGAVIDALRSGARDLVGKAQPDHLQLVVGRELEFIHAQHTLRRNDAMIRESRKRCQALLESSRDAITYVHEGMHVYANRAYLELFGYSEFSELEGTPIMDMVAPGDHAKFKEFLRRHVKGGEAPDTLELSGLLPDGNTFDAAMNLAPATIDGEPCTQIIIRSRLDQEELEKKIRQLSMKDIVTGLYNRQYLMDALNETVSHAGTGGARSALLYIVLDDFKGIKERVGVAGSDLVMGDVARLLEGRVGEHDVLARFGDNTFALITPEPDPAAVRRLADGLRTAVADHISEVGTTSVATTCSIGIAAVTEEVADAQDILWQADFACEKAQSAGGNRVEVFNPTVEQGSAKDRQRQWVERIRTALEKDRFHLVYQPIISLHGDANEMYEVLLRMLDEDGGELVPGDFLAPTEQAGLMADVDRWVFGHAIGVLAQRLQSGIRTRFFVKLSAASIIDGGLAEWLSETLKERRLPGDAIVLEIAESVAFTHLKQAKALVKQTRELHCGLALDHFGSGLNSFNLIKHLPADYLKIDGMFIRDLAQSQETQETVKSLTDMAHFMGKLTIAEWVEDAGTLAVLWQCGVNYIQGYFLQEPDVTLSYDFGEGAL